jgi:nucleotide-binding universal stress UspA family protein
MHNVWALASLWVGLALVATLLAIWFQISTALTEIVVGTVAQLVIGAIAGPTGLGFDGSPQAEKATEGALALARSLDAKALLLAVARPPEPATIVEVDAMLDEASMQPSSSLELIRRFQAKNCNWSRP